MTHITRVRRRLALTLALVAGAGVLIGSAAPGAGAAPQSRALAAAEPRDDEGGTKSLREQLDAASKGFIEAKAALAASKKRQKELQAHLKEVEAELAARSASIGEIADQAYRAGRLGPVSALLNATSPEAFLDRAAILGSVAANEDRQLRELLRVKDDETRAKLALDGTIREQQKQVTIMAKRKEQAERALEQAALVTGSSSGATSGPSASGGGGQAQAVRRNSDGSLPSESCSANDPTTSGCITPRTLHALNQAQAAGFTRFVSCFRSGGSGEHPLGRACDFAAQPNGFGGVATGGDKTYGDNLANYFVNNADRLGVLYVIWFREIWLPSSGWRAYSGAGGDPSSDHTNHVHLSVV